jgi:hypothetical protein
MPAAGPHAYLQDRTIIGTLVRAISGTTERIAADQ